MPCFRSCLWRIHEPVMRLLRKTGCRPNGGALFLTTVVSLLALVTADWSLQPDTVTDEGGNSADNASNIQWAAAPPGEPYVTSTTYETGFLTPSIISAHCFINLVQPNTFPLGQSPSVLSRTKKESNGIEKGKEGWNEGIKKWRTECMIEERKNTKKWNELGKKGWIEKRERNDGRK